MHRHVMDGIAQRQKSVLQVGHSTSCRDYYSRPVRAPGAAPPFSVQCTTSHTLVDESSLAFQVSPSMGMHPRHRGEASIYAPWKTTTLLVCHPYVGDADTVLYPVDAIVAGRLHSHATASAVSPSVRPLRPVARVVLRLRSGELGGFRGTRLVCSGGLHCRGHVRSVSRA